MLLGETTTTDSLLALSPDAVIVAVGAASFTPPIAGVDGANVRDAWKVLAGAPTVTGRVAVVVGGGIVACETAEHLAAQGCDVTILEMGDQIGRDISSTVRPTMLENHVKYGVKQRTGHKVTGIAPEGVSCEDKGATPVQIPCDYVVIATGARPVPFDAAPLCDAGVEVVKIGDCSEVGDISHATKTGYDAANAL